MVPRLMDKASGFEAAEIVPQGARLVLELPSDLRVIEDTVAFLVACMRSFAFGGARLTLNFRVGITEALANAMLYGNASDPSKPVRVELMLNPTRVDIRVVDQGDGFDPASVPDPTLPDRLQRSGGRGLFLIRQLMDEVEYNDRGNAVRLVLQREPARLKPSAGE